MMNFLKYFSAAAILAVSPLAAQDSVKKIGTVNIGKLFTDYYKVTALREDFKGYSEKISAENEVRVTSIKELVTKGREMQTKLSSPDISDEEKKELFVQVRNLSNQVKQLQEKHEIWAKQKQQAVREKARFEDRIILSEIVDMTKEYAVAEGYDFVFDRSGVSGANVPLLSYSKDATDLTAVLLVIINKDAPEKAEDEK